MLKLIHHLFIPHHTNNHRARILHNTSLFILSLALLSISFIFITIKHDHPDVLGISYSITENELLVLTNQVRLENNLPPLKLNGQLADAASLKAQNMFEKNYWAHFAPDGTTPWYFIKQSGYNYTYAGENLAKGFTATPDVVDAWMKSPTHRENILSNKYSDIGFSIREGNLQGEDTILVVEMFGSTGEIASEQAAPSPAINFPKTVVQVPLAQNAAGESINQSVIPQKEKVLPATNPAIDIHFTTKSMSLLIVSGILIILLLDLVIVERKKIPRVVGHNIDHILLVGAFIIFILVEKIGGIL